MKPIILAVSLATLPALAVAQATTDDAPSTENWWDRVGAAFFSDEALQSMRPEYEIKAQWTALSQDDQAALKARCAELETGEAAASPSLEDGMTDDRAGTPGVGGGPDAENSEAAAPQSQEGDQLDAGAGGTTVTGDDGEVERQTAAAESTDSGETGLSGQGGTSSDPGEAQLVPVCDLVRAF